MIRIPNSGALRRHLLWSSLVDIKGVRDEDYPEAMRGIRVADRDRLPTGGEKVARSLHKGTIFSTGLVVILLVLFVMIGRTEHDQTLRSSNVLTLTAIAIAAGTLLWLRPRAFWYCCGLACLLLALLSFWLVSPEGTIQFARLSRNANYGVGRGPLLAYSIILMIPLAWAMLAGSVGEWLRGIILYAVIGVSLASVLFVFQGQWSVPQLLRVVCLWPYYLLMHLGLFGWTVN